jgi:hypothetical protein
VGIKRACVGTLRSDLYVDVSTPVRAQGSRLSTREPDARRCAAIHTFSSCTHASVLSILSDQSLQRGLTCTHEAFRPIMN